MTQVSRTLLRALALPLLALALAVTWAGARPVAAYSPAGGVLGASCSNAQPGQSCTITATFTGPNGQPLAGVQAVATVSGCGSVSPTSTTTDANGTATFTFTASTTGCCGKAVITVTAGGQTAQTVINATCAGTLPQTSALPPPTDPPSHRGLVAMLLGIAAAAGVTGTALLVAPRRRRRGLTAAA